MSDPDPTTPPTSDAAPPTSDTAPAETAPPAEAAPAEPAAAAEPALPAELDQSETGSSTQPSEPPAEAEPVPEPEAGDASETALEAETPAEAGLPAEAETTAEADPEAEVPAEGTPAPEADDEGLEDGLAPLSDADLETALEALLLVVDSPAEEEALADALDTTPLRVAEHLRLLSDKYTDQDRGIDLRRAGGGWRFYTRDRYAPYVEKLLLDGQRAKLTRAALETLAVIAYRQPVTRARVAAVRGVNCDGVIRTLLARGLVEETGTDLETGGFLYRTTELFLERLGLSSLDDLPPIAPLLPEVDSIDEL